LWLALLMLGTSVMLAVAQGLCARLPEGSARSLSCRAAVIALHYLQPLVRGWWRYRTRLFPAIRPAGMHLPDAAPGPGLSLSGRLDMDLWDESWLDRTQLLESLLRYLASQDWTVKTDSGW